MSLGLESGVVRLVPHDPTWPTLFANEVLRLRQAIGSDLDLSLEHIGSTAVPGLEAKPIMDILGGYPEGDNLAHYISAIVRAGYEHRGESGIPGREFFRYGEPRTFHVHVVVKGGTHWNESLIFRDALIAEPALRDEYAALKRMLSIEFQFDREAYTEGKALFVQRVLEQVRRVRSTVSTKAAPG